MGIQHNVKPDAQFEWFVIINIKNWKGDGDPITHQDAQNITLHPCKLAQNLQFKVATALIPVPIYCSALVACTYAGATTQIANLEQFLR